MKRKKRELQVNLPLRKEMWRFTIFNSFKAKLPARTLHHQEKKKKRKFVMHRSKFYFVQVYFPFNREWWGLWKWVLPKEKYTASLYSNIGRIPSSCGGQLWVNSLLKPLYYGSLVCWLPAAQELFIRADRTLTGLRCGEKMVWKGIKRSRGPFSLVPPDYHLTRRFFLFWVFLQLRSPVPG